MRLLGCCCGGVEEDPSIDSSYNNETLSAKKCPHVPLGGFIGAAISALAVLAAEHEFRFYFNSYLPPAYRGMVIPLIIAGGAGVGFLIDCVARRCLDYNSKPLAEIVDAEAVSIEEFSRDKSSQSEHVVVIPSQHVEGFECERKIPKKKAVLDASTVPFFQGSKFHFLFTGDTSFYDVVKIEEISPFVAAKLDVEDIKALCAYAQFWVLADTVSPSFLKASVLKKIASYTLEDLQGNSIHVLNRILARLDDKDPDLEEKLLAIAACGHPGLWDHLLVAKAQNENAIQTWQQQKQRIFQKVSALLDALLLRDDENKIDSLAHLVKECTDLEVQYLCTLENFWKAVVIFPKFLKTHALEILYILAKVSIYDPKGESIHVINTMLENLEDKDPELEKKFLLMASCGHPDLQFDLLKKKSDQWDKAIGAHGNFERKIDNLYRNVVDSQFAGLRDYFAKIPTQPTPSLISQELEKTWPSLVGNLTPAEVAFLCTDDKFWSLLGNTNIIKFAAPAFQPASLKVLASNKSENLINQRIYVINSLAVHLSDTDPRLKEQLFAIAECGNPLLQESILIARAGKLDQLDKGQLQIKREMVDRLKKARKRESARFLKTPENTK